jgi:hypothetical protein
VTLSFLEQCNRCQALRNVVGGSRSNRVSRLARSFRQLHLTSAHVVTPIANGICVCGGDVDDYRCITITNLSSSIHTPSQSKRYRFGSRCAEARSKHSTSIVCQLLSLTCHTTKRQHPTQTHRIHRSPSYVTSPVCVTRFENARRTDTDVTFLEPTRPT